MPEKKIVAEAEIKEIISDSPEKLWTRTFQHGGVSKEFFDKYFFGKEKAFAYVLGKITIYDQPKELIEFGIKSAPQSYIYL